MLHVRHEQLKVLGADATHKLAQELAVDLRARLPHRCRPHAEPDLVALVVGALERAQAYGIEEIDDMLPYVELVVSHGLGFESSDEWHWAAVLLGSTSLSGSVRAGLLVDRTPPRHRPHSGLEAS